MSIKATEFSMAFNKNIFLRTTKRIPNVPTDPSEFTSLIKELSCMLTSCDFTTRETKLRITTSEIIHESSISHLE